MADFLTVNDLQRLHSVIKSRLAKNLNHSWRDIKAARFQHHRHDSQASHDILCRVFRCTPHARMGRQGPIIAAQSFKAVTYEIEMLRFFVAGSDPVVIVAQRKGHMRKPRNNIPMQINRVEFDMRNRMQKRDAAFFGAGFSTWYIARAEQLWCLGASRVHRRAGGPDFKGGARVARRKPCRRVLACERGFRAPVSRVKHLDRHFRERLCHLKAPSQRPAHRPHAQALSLCATHAQRFPQHQSERSSARCP